MNVIIYINKMLSLFLNIVKMFKKSLKCTEYFNTINKYLTKKTSRGPKTDWFFF